MIAIKKPVTIAAAVLLLSAPYAFAQGTTVGANAGASAATGATTGRSAGVSGSSTMEGSSSTGNGVGMSTGATGSTTNPDTMGARGAGTAGVKSGGMAK